ncbi:MAG TPA: hypothetical protein DEP84_10065, partial [Chloroflexi bacterium]|nr:hypothetical protein [Chloroflexota bacterium]
MNLSTTVLFFFTDLICPMIVGYGLRRRDLFNAEAVDRLIVFSILAFEPILGFLSFWRLHLDVRLAWLPILGAVMNVTPSILAFVRARYKYRDPLAQGGYVLATMLSNRGVVGTLTVFAIYGEIGYAVVTLLLLSSAPFLYSVGYVVAERFQRQHDRCRLPERAHRTRFFTWKQLPLLGLALGAVLNLGGVPRPAVAV